MSYSVEYKCSNCDWSGLKIFDRGKLALSPLECPRCGCIEARKIPLSSPLPPAFPCPCPKPDPWEPWFKMGPNPGFSGSRQVTCPDPTPCIMYARRVNI